MKKKFLVILILFGLFFMLMFFLFNKKGVLKSKIGNGPMKLESNLRNEGNHNFLPTLLNKSAIANKHNENMVWIPGGIFSMGSNNCEESLCNIGGIADVAQPIHRVFVDGFWMDCTEVTNADRI